MWTLDCKHGETILWTGQSIPLVAVDLVSSTNNDMATGHISYGIEYEDTAVVKYVDAATVSLSIRECGLFVDSRQNFHH